MDKNNKRTTDRDGVEVPVPGEDPGELELDGAEEEVGAGVDHGVGVVVGVQHPVGAHGVWGGGLELRTRTERRKRELTHVLPGNSTRSSPGRAGSGT